MFTLNNKHFLCIVDYHSKFPVIKKSENASADSLILMCKRICAEYGLLNENYQTQVVISFHINLKCSART